MKHAKQKPTMSMSEMAVCGLVIFLTIWLLDNLPYLFRMVTNFFK
jgi:hypothetical protein